MPAQSLLLSWKDHKGAIVSVFENLLKNNTLVDCTIAAEGQYLKAHKVVLSACSSYFELLFSQESEKNPIVILKDVQYQELEAVVNFMYRGEVEVREDRLAAFLEVANSLQIKGLGCDGKSQDSKEKVSSLKSSSAKSVVTRRQQSKKEVSYSGRGNSGQSSNVPSDCEHINNGESSADHQSSQRGCTSVLTDSTFSMESSSLTVRKEILRDSDSFENMGQSLPSFMSGESVQSEENPFIKTEPETDTFLEDQSDEEERHFVNVTMIDDQDDWDEPNSETMVAVPTSQQDIGAGWILPDVQQNFSSIVVKEEPGTSASWNEEAVAYGVSASSAEVGPSAGTSASSAGMDNLEDNVQPTPVSGQFNLPMAGSSQNNVSGMSADASLQRTAPRSASKKFFCPSCKKSFVKMMDFQRHIDSHCCSALPSGTESVLLPGNPALPQSLMFLRKGRSCFKCFECSYVTPRRSAMLNHFRIRKCKNPFKCPHCDYASINQSHLVRHLRTHTGEKPLKCPHCDYASQHNWCLKRHLLTHTEGKGFKCQHCDYTVKQKRNLALHLRTHAEEKTYKCSYCDFSSHDKLYLKQHQRVHTGEKPFKCSYCDYASQHNWCVKQHLRTHTGEKPFKCQHCDYAAGQKSNLLMHLKIHTGKRPFKCSHCEYATPRKWCLKQHLRIHTGEKPFKCPYCDYAAGQRNSLVLHLKRHTSTKSF